MTNLALLLSCFALGIVLRLSGRLPETTPQALNAFVVNVALPALILRHSQGVTLNVELAVVALVPWMLFAVAAIFFAGLSKLAGWSRDTTGALIITGGLANTSFVGLPMIETFYGPEFLPVGILMDQLGTYLVLSTVGIGVAVACSGSAQAASPGAVVRRVLVFPPFQALLLAAALMPFDLPQEALAVLDRIAGTLVPLALVSVGFQLRLADVDGLTRQLAAGLVFKLLLGPAVMAFLFLVVFRLSGRVADVAIFETAMGPQIGGSVIALQHGLNPRLVTLMVGVGIPLSLVTAAGWWWVLGG